MMKNEVIAMIESRLFKIIYHLMEKGQATAPELAEKFEVSVRTIYRDIDRISGAVVPVYSVAGRSGGIRLLDRFVLEKSLLSEEEMRDILFGLQSLAAVQNSDMETVLSKLRAAFQMADTSWIEVDVSRWGSDPERERLDFNVLKQAVMARRQIHFKYYGSNGMASERDCHPYRLIYKDKAWYLYAWCLVREDFRLFRLSRIKEIVLTGILFERIPEGTEPDLTRWEKEREPVSVVLRFPKEAASRVYDVFDDRVVTECDGELTVRAVMPDNEWLYGFLMSFGDKVTVLSPLSLKREVEKRLKSALQHYEEKR